MIQTQPLEVNDFTLGITDYFIDGNQRAAEMLDNFFITPHGKPRTRWGSVIYQDQLPTGTARVTKLSQLSDVVLAFQGKKIYRPNAATWAEIQGPAAGALMQAGDGNSIIVDTEWQGHTFFTSDALGSAQKVYVDSGGTYRAVNAGMPDLPAGVSVANPAGAGSTYLYAFYYFRSYTVGSVTYEDHGPVYYLPTQVTGGAITAINAAAVTLPAALAAAENYDTANMKIKIFRTVDLGTVFYYVGQVNYGVVAYNDVMPDATLLLNEELYTTGGIASNDTPPKAKFVHEVNGYGYWAHIKEGSETDPTLVRQSKSNDPDSVPTSFYANTKNPITGLSSIYDRPMVLTNKQIYRIDNYFADDGSGGMVLRQIDDKAGCISAQSIVQTSYGLFWAGELGFYWSDGFRVECVSNHLVTTYQTITSHQTRKNRISATYDSANKRVFWTACLSDGTHENDRMFVLDLRRPFIPTQENQGGCFTTMSGQDDAWDSFKPTQVMRVGKYIYRGDARGYVVKHGEEYATDPRIDTAVSPSTWEQLAIINTYSSCFVDFGSKFYRKWVPRILVSADNTTNVSIAISSSNDNDRVVGELKAIRYRGNIEWGDDLPLWADPTAVWNRQGLIEEWRRFPAGGLRCNYKQVTFTNAHVEIVDSDMLGSATVNVATKTATLGGTYNYLSNIVGYYIAFEDDNYDTEFLITAQTTTVVTYSDATNIGPQANGTYKWIIRGKPKGEILQINGYVLHWGHVSKSHAPYVSGSLGSNPA